jgi:hypothetical protein
MTLAALARCLDDFRRLRAAEALRPESDRLDLPDLALVAVRVTRETVPLADASDRVRAALSDGEGWARLRSTVVWSFEAWPDAGPPLFAEWREDASTSCRLRLISGTGSARVWTFTERPLGAADAPQADEVPALCERRWALAHGAPPGIARLDYHVYWGAEPHEDAHALRRRFDRFVCYGRTGK